MTPSRVLVPLLSATVLSAPILSALAVPCRAAPPAPPAIAAIARAALPAVVDIESIDPMKPDQSTPAPSPDSGPSTQPAARKADTGTLIVPPRAEQALGTGFFISPTGYIVTNHHVIAGATEIKVTLQDGSVYTAKRIGADEKADLAVLKIDVGHKLPWLRFGNSSKLVLGDWVVAIGNPFGLGFSISAGVVSALHRDIGSGPYDDFIQTDAAINRGNSGGPLLDAEGQVIGVDSAIYSPSGGSVGIGFAIPSSMVEPVADAIIAHGKMTRGWAGLWIEHVSEDMKAAWHLPSTKGVVVAGVVPRGPSAGKLEPSDVITEVDGSAVADPHQFNVALAEIPAGGKARIAYRRDGAIHDATITIVPPPKPEKPPEKAKPAPPEPAEIVALGVSVTAVAGGQGGLAIVKVAKDSPAARAGLKPDMVIEAVGPDFVSTVKELEARLTKKRSVALMVDGPKGLAWLPVSLGAKSKA